MKMGREFDINMSLRRAVSILLGTGFLAGAATFAHEVVAETSGRSFVQQGSRLDALEAGSSRFGAAFLDPRDTWVGVEANEFGAHFVPLHRYAVATEEGEFLPRMIGPVAGDASASLQFVGGKAAFLVRSQEAALVATGERSSAADVARHVQFTVLEATAAGRDLIPEMEYRLFVASEHSEYPGLPLQVPYGMVGRWNVDPRGKWGVLCTREAMRIVALDNFQIVRSALVLPLASEEADSAVHVNAASLWSASGRYLAVSIVRSGRHGADAETDTRLFEANGGQFVEKMSCAETGSFYPLAISDSEPLALVVSGDLSKHHFVGKAEQAPEGITSFLSAAERYRNGEVSSFVTHDEESQVLHRWSITARAHVEPSGTLDLTSAVPTGVQRVRVRSVASDLSAAIIYHSGNHFLVRRGMHAERIGSGDGGVMQPALHRVDSEWVVTFNSKMGDSDEKLFRVSRFRN